MDTEPHDIIPADNSEANGPVFEDFDPLPPAKTRSRLRRPRGRP
jgi:hypothetical protein